VAAIWGRNLTFTSEKDGEARRKSDDPGDADEAVENFGKNKKRGPAPEVGQALRAAYDQTLSEDIPPEMLDLLGKLG
jgi:parvulin-like peptidyl-prolyl isomerase